MEEYKYKISIKKGYKIFFWIFFAFSFLMAVGVVYFSIGTCETVANYIAVSGTFCFFVCCLVLAIYQITKSVYVYKDRVVYRSLFCKKEFEQSEIYKAVTKLEVVEANSSVTEGTVPGNDSWDEVTTFYDKDGKKLFSFGLAYENVQRLEKDILRRAKWDK